MKKHVFCCLLLTLLGASLAEAAQSISNAEVATLLSAPPKDLVLLDVRTPKEFAAGHLVGAVNMDIFDPQFASKLGDLDPAKMYVVYCRVNSRSGQAVELMDKAKFSKVYLMDQGMQGWSRDQLPTEK